MSDERPSLSELRAALEAATAGEWQALRGTLWAMPSPGPLIRKAPGYDTHYGPSSTDACAIVAEHNAFAALLDIAEAAMRAVGNSRTNDHGGMRVLAPDAEALRTVCVAFRP
jgi:hypothetical protein